MNLDRDIQRWLLSGFAALLAFIFVSTGSTGVLNLVWTAIFVVFWAGTSILFHEALERYNKDREE